MKALRQRPALSTEGWQHFMNDTFSMDEKLYRAVWPPEIYELFWRRDGSVSSAAFADPKGLSVDRGDYRSDADVISDMNKRFTGRIIRSYVKNCMDTGCLVRYLPSKKNPFHCEIHGSEKTVLLSKQQRFNLSKKAVVVF